MKSQLTETDYRINFWAFVWHATLLAFTKSFIDTDTVLPALILKAGGNEMLIGLMNAIMVGSAKFMQLFFAPYISSRQSKRAQLLLAINIRVLMIFALVGLIIYFSDLPTWLFFTLLFVVMTVFSWSGSYGGVAYTDLLGKSIHVQQRLKLFSLKQMFQAIGFVSSAFMVKVILNRYDFPLNYAYSFTIAGFLLALGSVGFWILREKYVKPKRRKSIWEFFRSIPSEVKANSNLKNFLITINLLGIYFAFTPFLMSYIKSLGLLDSRIVGNVLIIKMSGVVLGSLTVYLLKKYLRYKYLLIAAALISVILPISAIVFAHSIYIFEAIFFVVGIGFSLLRIAIEGIVIEISTDTNRAEYAGITGAANLSGIIFPFLLGGLLSVFSYSVMFLLTSAISLVSIVFIMRLNCQ